MTKASAARLSAASAVGLLLASAMLQISYLGSVAAHVADDFQPVVSVVWIAEAINFVLIAVAVVALRSASGAWVSRTILILALNPFAMGVLQLVYSASWPPPAAPLLAGLTLLLTGYFRSVSSAVPAPAA